MALLQLVFSSRKQGTYPIRLIPGQRLRVAPPLQEQGIQCRSQRRVRGANGPAPEIRNHEIGARATLAAGWTTATKALLPVCIFAAYSSTHNICLTRITFLIVEKVPANGGKETKRLCSLGRYKKPTRQFYSTMLVTLKVPCRHMGMHAGFCSRS